MARPTKFDKRVLLKLGVIGAIGSVDKWIKPIVNTVVLPAHAITSNSILSGLMGIWRARYIVENQPSNFVAGPDGSGFRFSLSSSGEFEYLSRPSNFTLPLIDIDLTTSLAGWNGQGGCCFTEVSGKYNQSLDELIGGIKEGFSGFDFFFASKE